MTSYEKLLSEINDFGIYQKLSFLLICLASLLPPMVTYMHSFVASNPSHRCKNPYEVEEDTFSIKYDFTNNSILKSLDKCSYSDTNDTKYKCSEWVFDKSYYQDSLTEEWSMVCSNAHWRNNAQTIYFLGYLIGSIVMGILADKFGRRPVMLSSFIMMIVGSCGVAFGPQKTFGITASYIIYMISRFIIACGTRGINVTGFVLAMEMMGPKKRVFAGIVIEYFFAIGQIILVAFAYTNNILFSSGWRTLAISLVIPTIPFLSYFFLLPESPRWLLSKNRQDEALQILEGVAKTNKTTLNKETWNSLIQTSSSDDKNKKCENIIDLIKSFHLGIMCVILFLQWIINNFIFYGVGLKSNDLGVNPYLSFLISAAVEMLAYAVAHVVLDKLGRKLPYVTSLALAGVSCFSIGFVSNTNIVVTLAMCGKFFASMSYAIIYLYSSELFPTSIRNTGMGCCSMMARIGSMTAPLVIGLGDTLNMSSLPFLVFGISGLIGCGTAIMLPETLNKKLPDTIKEAERINKFTISCKAYAEDIDKADETELKTLTS